MLTFIRRQWSRWVGAAAVAVALAALAPSVPSALAQAQKEPPAKEVTDGFFDTPARDPSEESPKWGLEAYIITAGFVGLGMFILCKTARRN